MSVEVVVPGSTANLGSGFDSIGMALPLFLKLRVSEADQMEVILVNPELKSLPCDENNLVVQVMKQAFLECGKMLPPLRIEIECEIPLTRGLGSSAAAIVGGLMAANQLLNQPWSKEELFVRATKWEGHLDNVGASLFGGVIIGTWDGKQISYVQADAPDLPVVVAIPDFVLSTKKARQVLPNSYARDTAILTSSRANLLTAAFLMKRWDLLKTAMQDQFHQPYRQHLVPGLARILEEGYEHGALGIALSGAGPTVIAFSHDVESTKSFLHTVFQEQNLSVKIHVLYPYPFGATVQLTPSANHSTFVGNG